MQAATRSRHLRALGKFHSAVLPKIWVRHQAHEAVLGIQTEQHHNDEFSIIKQKTKELHEKPKKHREPFLKNLFIKKIDPTILEFPELSQDQWDELMRQVEPIAERVRSVDTAKIDKNAVIPDDVLADLRKSGAFVHLIPRTHLGNDLSMVGYTAIVEALSLEGNVSLGAWAYTMGSWSAKTLESHGTEEQKAYYLPLIASGQAAFALCVSEAKSGSNVAAMETSVRLGQDNRGYILNGKKSWVVNAPKSDYFIVVAKHLGLGTDTKYNDPDMQFIEDKRKTGSMSAFIVPKKAPGVKVGEPVPFIGLRGLQVSELILDEVALPLDALLGKTGDGFTIAMQAVSMERHVSACAMIPLLKQLLDETSRYVSERQVFNRPLSEFHMVQEKLTETAYLLYALESMTYLTSLLIDTTVRPEFDMESAAVRAFAADIGPRCVQNLMEIFGASGITFDKKFDQARRDILTLSEIDGGTDISRLYISLSGFQYAGMAEIVKIQRANHPLNYPGDALKRVFSSLGLKRKKRSIFLDDYVHPTLQNFATTLELCCTEFEQCVEGLLLEYHKVGQASIYCPQDDLINKQVELKQIADMAVLLYASFAVLGRASRSYCVGMKNNKQEMNLAFLFMYYARRNIHHAWEDIGGEYAGRGGFLKDATTHMITTQSYGVEHPLTRNY